MTVVSSLFSSMLPFGGRPTATTTLPAQATASLINCAPSSVANLSETFRLLDCYEAAAPAPAPLAYHYGHISKLTLEKCGEACFDYDLFGVQYGTQCFCGNALAANATVLPRGKCFDVYTDAYLCAGTHRQKCGGEEGMSIYGRVSMIGNCPIDTVELDDGNETCGNVTAVKEVCRV